MIPAVVAAVKSLASALSIGSGAPVGREGPIIQIGAALGANLGKIFSIATWQRITLIASGAAGGIAATFNTPIGGILFATEIMLQEVSVRTLVPVAISSGVAAYMGQIFFGPDPSFIIPRFGDFQFHTANPWALVFYLILGALLGVLSALTIKGVYAFEDFFDKHIKGNYYTRHISGMFIVGILIYLMMSFFGHYYIHGVGYATIQDLLTGRLSITYLILLLLGLKFLVLALSLGSGASGGIFSPTLFMGAMLGEAFGLILQHFLPGLIINPAAFAVAGMAGAVGGTTGAAIASIVMIFEMTLDFNAIIPMTITVAVSDGVRRYLMRDTMYTLKLARRGHFMPKTLLSNFHLVKQAKDVMEKNITALPASMPLPEFAGQILSEPEKSHFLVHENQRIIGVIGREVALRIFEEKQKSLKIADAADKKYYFVKESTRLFSVVEKMREHHASVMLVLKNGPEHNVRNIAGVITKAQITDAMEDAFDLFSE
jgi:CIC family chloride channel protein